MSVEARVEAVPKPNIEIERRFLIKEKPSEIFNKLDSFPSYDIYQGYLKNGLRIRESVSRQSRQTTYTKNQKTSTDDPMLRISVEDNISAREFRALWTRTRGKRFSKTRYLVPLKDYVADLDFFDKDKVWVEVEFDSLDEAKRFAVPTWFGREITAEISNRDLAEGKPFPTE